MSDETRPPIWPPYEAFYIQSMLFSTKSAIDAVRTSNYSLDRWEEWIDDAEKRGPNEELIFDGLQALILSAAALSRYFWPSRNESPHKERAERLRNALGVDSGSALHNRDLRNALEHFDERLDRYLLNGPAGRFLPSYLGNAPEDHEVPTHFFRAYYTEPAVFEVLGERYEIIPIFKEVQRLHGTLSECMKDGAVLPRD